MSLRSPIIAEHNGGQDASTVFQIFVMTPPGIEPDQAASVEHAKTTCRSAFSFVQ